MKKIALFTALFGSSLAYAVEPTSSIHYVEMATQKHLAQETTWQRLMYANAKGQSEVHYAGYFLSPERGGHLQNELNANIEALFLSAAPNQSVRCKFPARSQWLIKRLNIPATDLPQVECPELDKWIGEIKPYKATLIYATDFMGNPSSMFGHTLLRLDPKDQKELNLVSYAVNYAATVASADGWSFAWKGLTGQYPGEYSLMPYYRKVKEYGDLESRDLWEYELNLNPEETRFLVQHIWEMQHVTFPYYFVSDNCAYRLLGLIDLVRPELNLSQQFKVAAIPMQTIKAIDQQGIVRETVYRPALETQLLAQAKQHGQSLAKTAHQVAFAEQKQRLDILAAYSVEDRAKILEMAYDDLYLQLVARKVDVAFAQPNLRELLTLRSAIDLERQRKEPERPRIDPTQSHDARNFSVKAGTVQGDEFIELGHRQAYHDLIDPQGGYRVGTQLLFWDGAIQLREDELKLEHFDFLTVNSYNPITAFKTPLTWGFNLGWQQEATDSSGRFSEQDQHGVASLKMQMGYSYADSKRENLCYAQMQTYLQGGKSLDKGWRLGMGPTVGCQNIWADHINSIVQVELPYWEDSHQWQVRLNSQVQYALNAQNALRVGWEYQYQDHQDWNKLSLGYVRFF
ncbi:Lnb N-terminal periplasmic domain-containing protein [Acinetobacter tandoii]